MSENTDDGTGRTYRHLRVTDAPDAPSPTRHKYEVDEAVDAREFGFNVYVADPGQRIPWGRHSHSDHEELFYVTRGAIEVEAGPLDDSETVRVEAGEAFFVPPNTPQRAVAVGEEEAEVIAAGAPKASDGAVIEEECPACGEVTGRTFEVEDDGDVYVLFCEGCGAEVDRLVSGSA